MRTKPPLCYFSEFDFVYDAVSQHFNKELPPDWKALVALANFPKQAVEQTVCHGMKRDAKTGKPVKAYRKIDMFEKEIRAFRENWARDPDLTLKILSFARETLARVLTATSDKATARLFLLRNNTIVKGNKMVSVTGPGVTDQDLVSRIFGVKMDKVEVVKKVRQSISYKTKG